MHTSGRKPDVVRSAVSADVVSYSAAISSCAKGRQWVHALKLMVLMEERSIKNDIVSYGAAIKACGDGGQ